VGGIEVIPFGILTFVIAMLVIANAWGAIDADLATTSAAREAVRAFVEAPDEDAAQQQAVAAATASLNGHGRSATATMVAIAYTGFRGWARCSRVTVTVRHPMPALHVPIIGGFGHGFDAVATESEVIDPYRSGLDGDAEC
jgi:hypothetical protein